MVDIDAGGDYVASCSDDGKVENYPIQFITLKYLYYNYL